MAKIKLSQKELESVRMAFKEMGLDADDLTNKKLNNLIQSLVEVTLKEVLRETLEKSLRGETL